MQEAKYMTSMKIQEDYSLMESLENKHLQSIKSLCSLLLREVETLTAPKVNTSEIFVGQEKISFAGEVRKFEINLITRALVHTDGNQTQAARLLGIKVTTLHTKIKRYKIQTEALALLLQENDRNLNNRNFESAF